MKYKKSTTVKKAVGPVVSLGVITGIVTGLCKLLDIELEEKVIGATVAGIYAFWCALRNWWKNH